MGELAGLSGLSGVLDTPNARNGGQYTIPSGPKCFGCQGFSHMKQECHTYLKTIKKSKALAATLSDTEDRKSVV